MHSDRIIIREEKFDKEVLRLNETLFNNANGYIGVRGTLEEGVPAPFNTMRGMYLGGVYEIIPMKQAESLCNLIEKKQTMLNVADTQTIYMSVNGEEFGLDKGTLLSDKRILNMDEGYTMRQITWRNSQGNTVDICIRRMAHFSAPNLFTIEYSVRAVDFEGSISFDSRHIADVKNYSNPDDPRLAAESEAYLTVGRCEVKDGISLTVSSTEVSRLSIATAVGHRLILEQDGRTSEEDIPFAIEKKENSSVSAKAAVRLEKGDRVVLTKYTVFSDSLRSVSPAETADSLIKELMAKNIEDLYRSQKDILTKFWSDAGMEIEGDDELELAMAFNMYQLFSSSPRADRMSMAAKGLTGEGYEGHYFWDTEMYALPFFVLTDAGQAKKILSFRYETLKEAKENALLLGHKKGALYPWRTITGVECSGYFPSGTAAYHINGAIEAAVISYYLATGDEDYILDEGEEILIETARLWRDVGNYDRSGRFVINEVTGPDEYTCMVDNNFYTNACAAHGMKWAVKLMRNMADNPRMAALKERLKVTDEELADILEAADKIYLPYDEELGISPQDDSFLQKPVWDIENTPREEFPLLLHYHPLHIYRYQVCKQADTVLAHFLFPDTADRKTMEKSYRYYEKITTHDSSLSTCVFSMQASRLGLTAEAEKYFGDSAKLDLYNLHKNTGDGVHTANMGGAYMAIVYGFAGVKISEEGLSIDPFIPGNLKGYSFSFIYRGRHLRLEVTEGRMGVTLIDGDELSFTHGGEKFTIKEKGVKREWNLKQ